MLQCDILSSVIPINSGTLRTHTEFEMYDSQVKVNSHTVSQVELFIMPSWLIPDLNSSRQLAKFCLCVFVLCLLRKQYLWQQRCNTCRGPLARGNGLISEGKTACKWTYTASRAKGANRAEKPKPTKRLLLGTGCRLKTGQSCTIQIHAKVAYPSDHLFQGRDFCDLKINTVLNGISDKWAL